MNEHGWVTSLPNDVTMEMNGGAPTHRIVPPQRNGTAPLLDPDDKEHSHSWQRLKIRRRLSFSRLCEATSRLVFWIAGADARHMRGRRREHIHFQLIGVSVVLTACASAVGMLLFIRLSVPGPWPRDIAFAAFWAVLIFWLDRWLVTRLVSGPLTGANDGSEPRGLPTYVGYGGRALLGLLLALTISNPIVLALFAPEVNQQVLKNQVEDGRASDTLIESNPAFVARRAAIAKSVTDAEKQETDALARRDAAQTALDQEINGTGGTRVKGCAKECRDKQAVLATATTDAQAATQGAKDARAKAATDTAALDKEIADQKTRNDGAIAAGDGALAKERALFDILFGNPILFLRWASITGLLILVDLMPIMLKMLSSSRSSEILHDRNTRLDLADDAVLAELERGTKRLKGKADHEVLRKGVRERERFEVERDAIDVEADRAQARRDAEARENEAVLALERTLENQRLEHDVQRYEMQGRYAERMAELRRRYGHRFDPPRGRHRSERALARTRAELAAARPGPRGPGRW